MVDVKQAGQETFSPKTMGKVISVKGPVVDVRFFDVNNIPALYVVLHAKTINKVKVTRVFEEQFGFRSNASGSRSVVSKRR